MATDSFFDALETFKIAQGRCAELDGAEKTRAAETDRLYHELDQARDAVLSTPATSPWALQAKLAVFESEALRIDSNISFSDCRELMWFGGIKADILALAVARRNTGKAAVGK